MIVVQCTAIVLTCKIGASGSWQLGGTMVTVFYVFICILCVVVERRLVLGVRREMCMCAISIFTAPYFSNYHARMVLDIVCSYMIT